MKKALIALTLLLALPLCAENYFYGNTSLKWILPGVGLGYRSYSSIHGWDLSAHVEGIHTTFWGAKARGLYLYRPVEKRFYFGFGGGAEYVTYEGRKWALPTADAVVGYEWEKSFLQFEATSRIRKKAEYFIPLPALTFGFHF